MEVDGLITLSDQVQASIQAGMEDTKKLIRLLQAENSRNLKLRDHLAGFLEELQELPNIRDFKKIKGKWLYPITTILLILSAVGLLIFAGYIPLNF